MNVTLEFAGGESRPAMGIPTDVLNNVFGSTRTNYLGRLQSLFGFYGIHTLTKAQTHRNNTLKGSPFSVVARVPCVWDPTKTVLNTAVDIVPSKTQIQESYCIETDFGGIFALLKDYRDNQTTGDEDAAQMVYDEIGNSLGQGLRIQTVAGGLHAALPAKAGTDAGIAAAWLKGRDAHDGQLKLMIDAAAGSPSTLGHLNQDSELPVSLTNDQIAENPEDIVDAIIAAAPQKLKTAVNTGGLYIRNEVLPVVIQCSSVVYSAFHRRYNETSAAAASNRQRITKRDINGVQVLYLDQMPVVLEDAIDEVDELVGRITAAITVSVARNVGLGSSFTNQEAVFGEDAGVGLVFQYGTDVEDAGILKTRGDQLISTSFSDTDLIAGAIKVYTPA